MIRVNLPLALLLPAFIISLIITLHQATTVKSATATNIVISEVQIEGTSANDEFVELYNPTSTIVDLTGWRLTRKNSTGTESNVVSSMSGNIPAHGYFLVAHPNYDGAVSPDLPYSATSSGIVANGTVLLYSDAGVTLVDKVGMGTAIDFEASAAAVPDNDASIERKAKSSSTLSSMVAGEDELKGNGEDSNNNLLDFVLRFVSQPQNSGSALETPDTSSPTPTNSPTASPSATTTASPSASPTTSPSPTISPSTSPSASPSASPTISPSSSPSASPTMSASPSPTSRPIALLRPVCSVTMKTFKAGFLTLQIPMISCKLERF